MRGGVRSADVHIPEELKHSLNEKLVSFKLEEKQEVLKRDRSLEQ